MTYEQFKNDVIQQLQKEFPECRIKNEIYCKANQKVDGVCLIGKDGIAPTFDLKSFYNDNMNVIEVITEISNYLNNTPKELNNEIDKIVTSLKNGDFSNVVPILLNKTRNLELLNTCIYTEWLDLVVVYKLNYNNSSVLISKDLFKHSNLTIEELHEKAIHNMSVTTMHILPTMLMISNNDAYQGASSILSTSTLNRWAKYFDCDLYIIPSSIHECIFVPVTKYDKNNIRYYLQNGLE